MGYPACFFIGTFGLGGAARFLRRGEAPCFPAGMRDKFDQQGMLMEEKMGKKFFCCDAVLDTKSRQIKINSGWAKEMQPISWKTADKRTYVHWAEKKYDVVVFGMPTNFHYGDGMGTNPIQMMQALSAQVIRHKRVLADHCVFIVSSICDGWFHEERWPYLKELYEMFQHDSMNILPDKIGRAHV